MPGAIFQLVRTLETRNDVNDNNDKPNDVDVKKKVN